eukprot:12064657-Prorocentrum_lima.AAC.1
MAEGFGENTERVVSYQSSNSRSAAGDFWIRPLAMIKFGHNKGSSCWPPYSMEIDANMDA